MVILVARRRDLRGLVSGVDVCVCVCYNGGGARFSTPSRRIHRTSSRASGSRAAAVPRLGLNRRSVTSRDGYFAHESSNRKEKTFERVQLCAPWRVRGESGLASYRLPKPNPARPKSWERSVVARRADGERRLLRVRRRGALHAGGLRGVPDGARARLVRVEEAVRKPASEAGFRQDLVVADEDVADGHAATSAKRMSDARDVRERESKAVAFGRRPGDRKSVV